VLRILQAEVENDRSLQQPRKEGGEAQDGEEGYFRRSLSRKLGGDG